MSSLRLAVIAAVAVTLTACGGAKLGGGKEGAAEAMFQASGPAASTKGAAAKLALSGATVGEVSVDGQHSGKATLSFDISDTDTGSGLFAYNVKYDNFSDDGKNYYTGQMLMKIKFDFSFTDTSATGAMTISMKGKINIAGEISDYLDADVTQTVDFNTLSSGSGAVTVKLNGTISTSTESHVFNNEEISFTADGSLPAAES